MRLKLAALALLAAFSAAVCARAQQTRAPQAGAPGVAVVKFSWDKERVNWERDPFGGPVENFEEMRVRARNEKRIDDAKRGGGGDVDRIRREARADSALLEIARQKGPPRYGFRYKLSVRNDGAKAFKEFDWDYVFKDAATGEEIGRHKFTSEGRVPPGKAREFSFFIPNPPALRVSAYALDKSERSGLQEQVVLVRVLYEDGTAWAANATGAARREGDEARMVRPSDLFQGFPALEWGMNMADAKAAIEKAGAHPLAPKSDRNQLNWDGKFGGMDGRATVLFKDGGLYEVAVIVYARERRQEVFARLAREIAERHGEAKESSDTTVDTSKLWRLKGGVAIELRLIKDDDSPVIDVHWVKG